MHNNCGICNQTRSQSHAHWCQTMYCVLALSLLHMPCPCNWRKTKNNCPVPKHTENYIVCRKNYVLCRNNNIRHNLNYIRPFFAHLQRTEKQIVTKRFGLHAICWKSSRLKNWLKSVFQTLLIRKNQTKHSNYYMLKLKNYIGLSFSYALCNLFYAHCKFPCYTPFINSILSHRIECG